MAESAKLQPVPTADQLMKLVRRAEDGDEAAVPELRAALARPGVADALGGNLAAVAAEKLLRSFSGGNLCAREAVTRKMADLRAELGGPNPSGVERLLAERAVCCWLHLYHLEANYAGKPSMSLDLGAYYQTAIDRAHKRYLSALKALADVRKIGLTLQVNLARKQVNVAGGVVVS